MALILLAVGAAFLCYAILCVARWQHALLLYIGLLPFLPGLAAPPGLSQWPPFRLPLVPLLVVWLGRVALRNTAVPRTRVDLFVAIWVVTNLVACAASADVQGSLVRTLTLAEYLGLYYIVVDATRRSPRFAERALAATAWAYAGVVTYGLVEIVVGRNVLYEAGLFLPILEDYVGTHTRAGITRIAGPLGQPINMALYLGMVGPAVAVYLLQWRRGRVARTWSVALFSAALIAMFWTASRGPWLGSVVGLVVFAWLSGVRPRLLVAVGWGGIVLGVVVAALGIGGEVTQFLVFSVAPEEGSPESMNVAGRIEILRVGMAAVRDHLLFGLGPGVASHELGNVVDTRILDRYGGLQGLENQYVYTALDTGVVGLAAYVLLLIGVLRALLVASRRAREQKERHLTYAAVAAFVTFAVTSATVQTAGFQTMALFLLAGLVTGLVPADRAVTARAARGTMGRTSPMTVR